MVEGWVMDVLLKGYIAAGMFAFVTLSFAVISVGKATEKA